MTRVNDKKEKREKKVKEVKTLEERLQIVKDIYDNFQQYGIPLAEMEGLGRFRLALTEYSKEGVESGICGRYYVPELNRYIDYILPALKSARDVVKLTPRC